MDFAGHIAALLAASSFSITSTLFALSGRYFRPSLVMQGSLPMGMICLFWLHWLVTGHPVPVDMNNQRLLLLGGSGIIGFWLGSIALVNALIRLGPRLALLIGATGPILSTLLAWIFLGEVLDATAVLGIMTTMGGIAWVVSENGDGQKMAQPADYRAGIIFALMAAVGQAISFLLSKEGLSGDFDPLSASLMRISIATVAIWTFAGLRGRIGQDVRTLRQYPKALRQLGGGAVTGPVAGASLVMFALQHAPIGIASTLANLTPIFLIPIGYVVFKERITRRAVIGTLIAMSGTALLFL